MTKVDLKKQISAYSATAGQLAVVDVPPLQYLMVDCHGDPTTSTAYRDAVTSVYPLAYKLTFARCPAGGLLAFARPPRHGSSAPRPLSG